MRHVQLVLALFTGWHAHAFLTTENPLNAIALAIGAAFVLAEHVNPAEEKK